MTDDTDIDDTYLDDTFEYKGFTVKFYHGHPKGNALIIDDTNYSTHSELCGKIYDRNIVMAFIDDHLAKPTPLSKYTN